MSTFQRLFIVCIFVGLGLAAAAVIVQAPQLPAWVLNRDAQPLTAESRDSRSEAVGLTSVVHSSPEFEIASLSWPEEVSPKATPAIEPENIDDERRESESDVRQEIATLQQPRQLLFAAQRDVISPLPPPPPVATEHKSSLPSREERRAMAEYQALEEFIVEPFNSDSVANQAVMAQTTVDAQPANGQPVATDAVRPSAGESSMQQEPALPKLQSPKEEIRPAEKTPLMVAAHTQAEPLASEGDGLIDINIPDTDIREVLQLLGKAGGMNILASPNVTGQVKATLTGVDVDTALGAILRSTGYVARREGNFVYVGTSDDFQAMDHAVDRVSTRVYRPNYVTAAELQTLFAPMLTPVVGSISISSAAEVGIASDKTTAGGDNFAGAEVVLVRDYVAVLSQIDQVFQEVDRRPLQVSIEAMILSVKLDDEYSLGVDWELLRENNNVRLVFGSPPPSLDAINTSNNSGLVFGYLDSNIGFFLDALETIGETHVISQPRLMCLNKQRAEIHIGEERGYVSTTVTETSATQSVEFLEVGTQLRLRPFISSDGLIRLEIHPELSTGTVEVSDNFTLPNKTVTQVTTNVMVRDGATVVIGGLLREELHMETEQIPLLGSLPVVGPLFRSKNDRTTRDEIVVLITPRIVWEPQVNCEGEYVNCEGHQQHAIMADKMSPVSRNFFGRKYRRLAKAAWVAGDAKAALRYINLSIHFNSLDRQSVQLRSEIIAQSGIGDYNVHTHLKEGLYPWQHPVGSAGLTNWVLDDIHGPHTHLGQEPAQVVDPGVSGASRDLTPMLHPSRPVIVDPRPRPLNGSADSQTIP